MVSNVELLNFQDNCCVTCVFETTHVGNCSLPFAVLTFSLKNNLIENSPTYNSHDMELCTLYFTVWLHKSLGFSMQQINHFPCCSEEVHISNTLLLLDPSIETEQTYIYSLTRKNVVVHLLFYFFIMLIFGCFPL